MLAGGLSLLAASLVRRYFQPNPLVNLPFLNARNIVILGLGVFTIRFALLAPVAGIPGFLGSIQQYRPIQTGAALAWVAAPQFVLVWIAAIAAVFIPAAHRDGRGICNHSGGVLDGGAPGFVVGGTKPF